LANGMVFSSEGMKPDAVRPGVLTTIVVSKIRARMRFPTSPFQKT